MTRWRERRLLPDDVADSVATFESNAAAERGGGIKNEKEKRYYSPPACAVRVSTRRHLTSDAIFWKESRLTALSDGRRGEWLRRDSAVARQSQWRRRQLSARIARGELWVYFRV